MDALADMDSGRRQLVAGVVILVLAAATVFVYTGPRAQQPADQQEQQQQDAFEQYADADQETGTTNAGDATVAAKISISEFGVTPARAEIKTGQAVTWTNKNSFPVRLEFDRTSQTPTLEPGEELSMRFRGITYYKVFNTQKGDRIARGSIYVE